MIFIFKNEEITVKVSHTQTSLIYYHSTVSKIKQYNMNNQHF